MTQVKKLMINLLINNLSSESSCQFQTVGQTLERFSFYQANSNDYQRFLVIVQLTELMHPKELNRLVLSHTPNELIQNPSFAKNTDVVVLFKLKKLSDIVQFESDIFVLEEDSYSFKKHVLYYSRDELNYLAGKSTSEIMQLVKNQDDFNKYKESPLTESAYSLASRLFIKLPFLSVPVDESELDDPCSLADQHLQQAGLLDLHNEFENMVANGDVNYQTVIKEYIRGQMANSQAED